MHLPSGRSVGSKSHTGKQLRQPAICIISPDAMTSRVRDTTTGQQLTGHQPARDPASREERGI